MTDNNEYRYAVDPQTGTITRGRVYRLPDDWTTDAFRNYWDGDFTDAFTVYWRGWPEFNILTDGFDVNRVLHAIHMHRQYANLRGGDKERWEDMLNRPGGLAFRLTGNWDSRFICVGLDRGHDLYALAWGGDPDNEWHDEIEELNSGNIYRMECWSYDAGLARWVEDDDFCDEWYGEDKATAELERQFPLVEFPAELLIEERAS